jgi:hypothetical protein
VTYGGDSGNRIFVLYWRSPLITVSVIRGSNVVTKYLNICNSGTSIIPYFAFVLWAAHLFGMVYFVLRSILRLVKRFIQEL